LREVQLLPNVFDVHLRPRIEAARYAIYIGSGLETTVLNHSEPWQFSQHGEAQDAKSRHSPGRSGMRKSTLPILLIFFATPSWADAAGYWRLPDGDSVVRVHTCGKSLCGSMNGGSVFGSMHSAGRNVWAGSITDVRTGNAYIGTASLSDANTLAIHACIRGTTMCDDQVWTRANATVAR
jgi:hypothetical protein